MSSYYNNGRDDSRRLTSSAQRPLHHQVSNISEVSDFGRNQDEAGPGAGAIKGRPSLVSLPSMASLQNPSSPSSYQPGPATQQYATAAAPTHPQQQAYASPTTHSYAGWAASSPFGVTAPGGVYSPVGDAHHRHASAADEPSGNPAKDRRKSRRLQDTIPEEGEMGDMSSAKRSPQPWGTPSTPYFSVPSQEPEPVYDLSTVGGDLPWGGTMDADTAALFQRQEASGHLTGGLGEGFRSNTTIRQADLVAAAPKSPLASPNQAKRKSMLGRKATIKAMLGRKATVKDLGQIEANRRGEIIEVVMDAEIPPPPQRITPADTFDLSEMGGPLGDKGDFSMRTSTFPVRQQTTQVFYPQPNWKPFVMRPLFLGLLITLSVALGIGQEVLYRASAAQPLLKFRTPEEIPRGLYFAFKFLPTMISVTYGVLWSMADFEIRRLEAFYQLSKEDGASAGHSINVDYITSFSFMRPVRALRCEHYAVFISSTASLLAISLVPTLVSASIILSPDRHSRMLDPMGEKTISINGVWSRILTTMLFVIAGLGCALLYQLQTRRSGLLSDVKGIAGLASMAVVSHILMDFKDMDLATHHDIHQKLKKRRYVLRNSSLAPDDNNKTTSKQETKLEDLDKEDGITENPHPLMLRSVGVGSLVVGIVLFLILVQVVLFTEATVLTDQAPWVITALSVAIKMSWSGLDTDMRMMEPYYILWRRHAEAKTLTLDYTAMPFGWVAIQGALNRHFLIFFVGLGTVMSEVLTVLATSLATVSGRDFLDIVKKSSSGQSDPDADWTRISSGQETVLSFWATHSITTFILVYMAAVATAVLVLRRRPFLPRQPNTIASVLAFIHQSKMIYDFVGTSKLKTSAMAKRLEQGGKTYGVGWFQGRDGNTHCGVDQEELSSEYKFGYDYSKAKEPWIASQEWM
ncbi:hypothetical protein RB594_001639 [Gaeumannomyces avenae]